MLTDLHEDVDTADKLEVAFESGRIPREAREGYARIMKASERHAASQGARRTRADRLTETARASYRFMHDYERALAHGEEVAADWTQKYDREKVRRAKALAEAKAIRDEPITPNLPYERLAEFILDSKDTAFEHVPVEASLAKGQTLADALDSVREEIAEIGRKKREARTAPVPLADAKKRIAEDVYKNALAPDVSGTTHLRQSVGEIVVRENVRRPDMQGHVEFPSREIVYDGGNRVEVDLGVRMLCWLFPDQIIAKLCAELEKSYAGKKPLSVAERNRIITQLEAEQLEAERREEAIIRAMEDAGQTVWRRPSANPIAVLGIRPIGRA